MKAQFNIIDIQDKNKKTKLYRLKDNIRFKPLEYITEDLDLDMIEEVRKEI